MVFCYKPAMPTPLELVEVEATGTHDATVIWLHGLGASGHDFEPIPPLLGLPNARFVFPHASYRRVTINFGMEMRAWYDILTLDRTGVREKAADIREAATQVEALIADERARGIPAERIVIAGFSQGGAMALHVGLRHAEPLAGIMVLSAYELLAETRETEAHEANAATAVLMAHGEHDPVVPVWLGEAARDALKASDPAGHRPLEWHTYPMQHEVCPEELRQIAAWLHARIGPA